MRGGYRRGVTPTRTPVTSPNAGQSGPGREVKHADRRTARRIVRRDRRTGAALEAAGYDGGFTAETAHDPFLPLAIASQHTERIELGTGIAVAFARHAR